MLQRGVTECVILFYKSRTIDIWDKCREFKIHKDTVTIFITTEMQILARKQI